MEDGRNTPSPQSVLRRRTPENAGHRWSAVELVLLVAAFGLLGIRNLVEALLEATITLVEERGVDAVSVREATIQENASCLRTSQYRQGNGTPHRSQLGRVIFQA